MSSRRRGYPAETGVASAKGALSLQKESALGTGLAQAAHSLDITAGPLGEAAREGLVPHSEQWLGLELQRSLSHQRWLLQCSVCSASHQGSAAQVAVKGDGPAIWNHSQGACPSLLLPTLRWKSGLLWFLGPSSQEGLRPCPSPGRHIFKDGSLLFSSLPPGLLSLKPSAACVQASCSHTSHFCCFFE